MFGGHRYYVSVDIMVLVCHVISQDPIIKESCNFIGRSSSSYHSANFSDHKHSGSGDIVVFVCQIRPRYQSVK